MSHFNFPVCHMPDAGWNCAEWNPSGLLFLHNCRAPNQLHPSAINCRGVGQIMRFYKPDSSRTFAILMRCGDAIC